MYKKEGYYDGLGIQQVSLKLKLRLFNSKVIFISTYGCKSWNLSRAIKKMLLGFGIITCEQC